METTQMSVARWDDKHVVKVAQSCLTLCDPMDCSLPGSSFHGIFQARILKWVAISFSRISSWPRDWTWVSCIVGRHFTFWATYKGILLLVSHWVMSNSLQPLDLQHARLPCAFSWQNSISLCTASFHIPRPNLPVTPGVSWLPTSAFQSPIMKRTSFLGVSTKRSCRSSQNCSTSASSALLVGA